MLHSKRRFLKSLFLFIPGSAALALTPGCATKENNDKTSSGRCDDFSGVSENDLQARKSLGYQDLAPLKDKSCATCALFLPSTKGQECGNCSLFKGPVSPRGSCTYWAPKNG